MFLADASPLENEYLGSADNAAFALALAGADGRPVVFAEGVHGFGTRRGLGAIPGPWKVALLLLALAALAFVWSRARRFGPPDRPARRLPPARAEYVRGAVVALERTRDPTPVASRRCSSWARDRIVGACGAARDGNATTTIAHAAHALGYPDDEIAAADRIRSPTTSRCWRSDAGRPRSAPTTGGTP